MAAVRLITVCITLINLVVCCDGSANKFHYGLKEYTIVLNKAEDQERASQICKNDYGSTLADVLDNNVLEKLNDWLFSLSRYTRTNTHELWTKGRSSGFENEYTDLTQRHKPGPFERILPGYDRTPLADCGGHDIESGSFSLADCGKKCTEMSNCVAFARNNDNCWFKSKCYVIEKVNHDVDIYTPIDKLGYTATHHYDIYGDFIKLENHPTAEACSVVCSGMDNCDCFVRDQNNCWFKGNCNNPVAKTSADYYIRNRVSGYTIKSHYDIGGDFIKMENHPTAEACSLVCSGMDNCDCFVRDQNNCWFKGNCTNPVAKTSADYYTRNRYVILNYEKTGGHVCRVGGNPVSRYRPLDRLKCSKICSGMDNCVAFETHDDQYVEFNRNCEFYTTCPSLMQSNLWFSPKAVYRRVNTKCLILSNKHLPAHPGYNVYNKECSGARNFICEKTYFVASFPAQLAAFPLQLREVPGWIARFDDYRYRSVLTGVTVYTHNTTGELMCVAFTYGRKKTPCRGYHDIYPNNVTAIENTILLQTGEFFNYAKVRTRSTWRFPIITEISLNTTLGRAFGPFGVSTGSLHTRQNNGKPLMYVSGVSGEMLNQLQFHFFDHQVNNLDGLTSLIASKVYTAYQQGNMAELVRINNKYQNMVPNLAKRGCDVFKHLVITGTDRLTYEAGCKLMLVLQQLDIYTASSDTLKKHLPRNLLKIAEFDSQILLKVETKAQQFHDVLTQVVFTVTQVGSQIQNTTITVNQNVANKLQDYFVTVANFDKNIAKADRDFVTGRLQTLTRESKSLSSELQIRLRLMLSVALGVTTADLAEAVARLAAAIAKASNPIGWIFGGSSGEEISERLAAVAEAQRKLAQAVRLMATLHVFTKYLKELAKKVDKNKDQLDVTRRVVDQFATATDAQRVGIAREFLQKYNDYKPYVKAFDVVYATELLATVVEEGCSLIDGATGTIANILVTVKEIAEIPATLANEKPQTICTQLPAMIAKLEQMYHSVFDFQFELMDAFSSIARENIVQEAARGLSQIATVKKIDVVTATVGSLNGAMRTQNAAKSRCFELEYQNGGYIPEVCKYFFFTDPLLSRLTAYKGTIQSSKSERYGYIPMNPPAGRRTQTYLDVEELISKGVAHFQLPINNRGWMVKYGWLPYNADKETAYFIEKFEMFIPGLKCMGMKTFTMHIDVTSGENIHLYKQTAPPSYIIPKALYRFIYTATTENTIPCASGKIIEFQLKQNYTNLSSMGMEKVCEVSEGVTVNDLKPSVYSNWIIKLKPPYGCVPFLEKTNTTLKEQFITVRYKRVDVLAKGTDECYPNTRCGVNQKCVDQVLSYSCQDLIYNP